MKLKSFIAACVIVLPLAACGGPSDGDVQDAYRRLVKASPLAMMSLGIGSGLSDAQIQKELDKRVDAMQIIVGDKTKQGDGSYAVIITVKGGDQSNTNTVHMIKGADGWVIIDK